ncbi:hypothetical protein ACTG9Q_21490 [Actinokineospora sp. 24-640]
MAHHTLPAVAEALRAQRAVVTAHEGLEGPGTFGAVYPMEHAYARFTDMIGTRLWLGAERIDETAHVLTEIIELYRRADGQ